MERPASTKRVVLTYAILSLLARAATAQLSVLMIWYGRRCYERSRGELIMMIYEKALSRKNVIGAAPGQQPEDSNEIEAVQQQTLHRSWARGLLSSLNPFSKRKPEKKVTQHATVGKILNVIRGDIYEVAQRFWEIDQLLKIPFGAVIAAALIWKLLGPSCFLGLVTLLTSQLLNYWLIKLLVKWQKIRKAATDGRIQSTAQFIEVIRHLRWYGWQNHWLGQVEEARSHELNIRFKVWLLKALVAFLNALSRGLFPVVALYSYTYLAGNTLSVDLIFPALSLFSSLDARLTEIPSMITTLINAHISMQRINGFMDEPELETIPPQNEGNHLRLSLVDGSFAWPEQKTPVLKHLNLAFSPGLTLVTGKVGAGKTALLQCLLGELDQVEGSKSLANEAIGYCSQTPWLQSMSIRDNILFQARGPLKYWRKWYWAFRRSESSGRFGQSCLQPIPNFASG
jgi:ABC-type bacteriocin/lantibiotic exporter with double-glycine peptidase domain